MMSKKSPQLRFEGFTDDWEEHKLGKVFDTITDYVANGSFESLRKNVNSSDINGFAYLVRLQDASNNWQGPWLYTDQHGYEFLKKSKLQPDDIIMANVGSVGKFFLVPKLDKPMTLAPNAVLIKSSENDQGFLYQMMLTPEMQYKIFEKTTPGVQSKINKTDFKMIETRLPNIEEQQKIGSFFKQLDETIALHQRKLDLLKEQKKGYLQKMFPKNGAKVPELRFAGFADDWEERKLGQYTKLITKGTTPKDKTGIGDVNFVKVENITNGKIYPINKIKQHEHDNYLKRSRLEEKDILFSIAGTLGRTAIVNKSILPANTNQALAIIRGYDFDTNFLITSLAGNVVKEYIRRNPTVGAQPNLSLEQVGNLLVNTPNAEEQQKIGSFFKQLDNTIALHQRKLDLLKEQKKGFLQKMFV
ncbi:restriction endonuclease subunit S [Lactococcus lactis]|uniref:restriction endonuclease subunit S n=1 Tax=Lactococcus lactis TaxID=1358 RepID=UPI002147AC94|nr:restriction endonuclease subunit S [Lactococcus lactis]